MHPFAYRYVELNGRNITLNIIRDICAKIPYKLWKISSFFSLYFCIFVVELVSLATIVTIGFRDKTIFHFLPPGAVVRYT